jgi:glycerophosphoryl diester phosphodiesterase|tara:strand:- start:732 stop:1475 length:744 start_codon:yes stop_codon:yes gene_type:complete
MLNLPKLIGHRGVKNLSPENTIESINLAKGYGLNWVEIDVKISKDLIPIILHDDTLERTTNGKGLPVDFCYNELKKLDAGSFFYNKQTKIYIPTFEEILLLSQNKNISLNIELKPNKGFERKNVESIAKIIKKSKFLNQYYFSSFDWDSLILMKEILPNANYGLLVHNFTKNRTINDIKTVANKYDFFCCGFNLDIINSEVINEILKNNLIITVYSKKNIKVSEANILWSNGIKSIFTDDPREYNLL